MKMNGIVGKNKLKIRLAAKNDVIGLVNVNAEGEPLFRNVDRKMFLKKISAKQVFCAEIGKKIVGLLYWQTTFLDRSNQWYLQQITVGKKYRRQDIGYSLLKYFLNYAKRKKIEKVFGTIHNDNYPSLLMNLRQKAIVSGYLHGLGKQKDDGKLIMRWDLN